MHKLLILLLPLLVSCQPAADKEIPSAGDYLGNIKTELEKKWPENRTINLVFHGHSVPAGYASTPEVNTFDSYPFQLLREIKNAYPFAVVNVIITSKGGENSVQGAKRFDADVMPHQPDVIFIDYSLNDRSEGPDKSGAAWESMIEKALKKNIKVILLTPSPDLGTDMSDPGNELEKHAGQVRSLAAEYGVGLCDSYAEFMKLQESGDTLSNCMAQSNHPNEKGNLIIARSLFEFFKKQ